MKKSDAKKGLVLVGLEGGVGPIAVTSLGAGSDKGETELRLPLRRFIGLCGPYVVVLCLSWRYCVLAFLCHLFLVFILPLLCLVFVFVLVFVLGCKPLSVVVK